ncbi:uncharacterized protein [Miscanthus floridulus]|uniref:uncharacterized protein isoform X2 n=1 Tax=Miscanthus floridulus TaxID=154761 RepID=UPI003458A47A
MLSVQETRLLVRGCFNCRSMNGHDLHIYHQACESSIPLQSEQPADFRRTRRRLFAASRTENADRKHDEAFVPRRFMTTWFSYYADRPALHHVQLKSKSLMPTDLPKPISKCCANWRSL